MQTDLFKPDTGPPMPPHEDSDTSRAAARMIQPATERLRARVLAYLVRKGVYGATDPEIHAHFNLGLPRERYKPSTLRARRIEMFKSRWWNQHLGNKTPTPVIKGKFRRDGCQAWIARRI